MHPPRFCRDVPRRCLLHHVFHRRARAQKNGAGSGTMKLHLAGGWLWRGEPVGFVGLSEPAHRGFAEDDAGRERSADFQIIVTPPISMPIDSMQAYAEVG